MPRNLLFITTDQQRWDSLPCYGRDFVRAPNLERLAREGMVFDTCIVPSPVCFTSDHGDALGDHGLPFKGFFYDCMARVPLIIRGPGVPPGKRSPALVSTLDLVPLFYRACDLEPPRTLQGADIRPLFENPAGAIREAAFSEIGGRVMVRTNAHKYAHYADGSAELYDLKKDPCERPTSRVIPTMPKPKPASKPCCSNTP